MILSGIAQRYARALLQAALSANAVDEVFSDTQSLSALLSQDPSFRDFLLAPQMSNEQQRDLVKKALEGRVSKLVLELLGLLIEKKRVMFVSEILEAYRYLYEKHKGIIEVKAITAVPLDEALLKKLRQTLEDQTKKTIRLTTEVEPEIIGGMVLKLEDKVIDGSLRYELEQFKRHLIETSVVQAQLGTDNQE